MKVNSGVIKDFHLFLIFRFGDTSELGQFSIDTGYKLGDLPEGMAAKRRMAWVRGKSVQAKRDDDDEDDDNAIYIYFYSYNYNFQVCK